MIYTHINIHCDRQIGKSHRRKKVYFSLIFTLQSMFCYWFFYLLHTGDRQLFKSTFLQHIASDLHPLSFFQLNHQFSARKPILLFISRLKKKKPSLGGYSKHLHFFYFEEEIPSNIVFVSNKWAVILFPAKTVSTASAQTLGRVASNNPDDWRLSEVVEEGDAVDRLL